MLAAVGTGGVVGGEDGRTLSPPRQPDEEGGKSARAICNGGEDDGGSSGSQGGYSNSDVDGEEGDESTQIDANSGEWSDTASYVSDSDGDSHCSGRSSGRDGVAVGRDRSGGGDGGGGAGMGGGRSDESAGIGTGRTGARRADGSGRAGWRAELGVNSVVVSAASPTSAGGAGPSSSRQKNTGSSPMLRGVRSRGRGCAGAMPLDDNELATSLSSGGGIDDDDEDDEDDDGDDADDDDDDDGDTDDPLEPIPGEVKLVPSMFPDRPPTVFFEYPKELGMARFDNVCYSEPLGSRRLLFKCHWERNSVKNAFYRAGFSRTKSTLSWTASWGKHPTREGFRNLNRFQKVNHFPGSWCIGRKDRLMRTLARHKREVSSAASAAAAVAAAAAAAAAASTTAGVPKGFGGGGGGRAGFRLGNSPGSGAGSLDVTPDGFILPADRRAWLKAVEEEPKAIWIVKPPASSCGRGIRVINRSAVGSVSKSKKCLVQRYIHNPMLIDGRKFDLRLYVLVTSMEPLRVYLFEEGLVRLSTKKYSLKNLRSRFTHLTNYSINKRSGSFKAPDDSDGLEATESTSASKWALTFFWKYLEQSLGKAKSEQVQRSVEDVVLRTMAAADGDMTTHSHQATRHRDCCYELFGFDVLLDEHLKPWLLEVNISPSLFGSSALDRRIKGTLVADIFHLVGFRPFDRTALRREERIEAKHIPGTKRATRAVAGRPQDAWRRFQTPASINLGELGEDEWEVIRDTEDEQHRAGHFRILYPTAENVARLWSTFRSPRFLNGVLARWVLTGGLSNLSNRADIGLIAERLATLGGGGARHAARGKLAGGSTESGGCSTSTSRGKGRGSGPSCGGNADGRWEETTSNATTVVSGGGRGARLELGGLLAGGAPPPWPGAASARPASSATSRASRSSSLARRPLWRETSASASARVAESGPQRAPDERSGNGSQSGRRSGSGAGGGGGSSVRGARGAPLKAGSKVPRLQPRRIDSRVVVGPSLLTVRTNPLSARRIGSGNGGGGGDALEVAPKAWRASSASSSRQSTGRSNTSNKSFGGSVAKLGAPLSSGVRLPVDDRRGSRESLSLLSATKGRDTGRRKPPPPLQQGKQQRQQQRQQEQEQGQQKIHGSRRAGFVGYPVDAATAAVSVVDDTGAAAGHAPAAQADLGSRMTDAAFISPLGHAIVGNGACFPRPPCRAGRHAVESVDGGAVDPLPAFPAATLPTRCSKLTATDGVLTPRSVSGAALRTRVNAESGRGNRVRDSNIGGSSSSGGGGGDGTSGSSGSSSSSSGGNDSIALGLLVDSRALKGVLVEPSALSLRGGGGARGLRENMAAAMAAAMAAQPPRDGLFPISIAKGSGRAAMP